MSKKPSGGKNSFFLSSSFVKLSHGKKIALVALFVALSVIANAFLSVDITADMKLSFTNLTVFLAGMILGPALGFLVGFLGDLLAFFLFFGNGIYLPFVSLSLGLMGFIAGLAVKIPFKFKGSLIVKIIIGETICLVLCTALINCYGFYELYGLGETFKNYVSETFPSLTPSFTIYVFYRLIVKMQLLIWGINAALVCVIAPVLSGIKGLKISFE